MKPTRVRTELRGAVAILTLDNPPVNCLDRPTRQALLAALEDAERNAAVTSVVLTGARNFSAGADLGEFDNGEGLAEPTLHLTITGYLDRMTKPVVAAIAGAALGGGLELALACHARIATSTATLGLPETTLGFMPGAGGTQRLPRAIGLERATSLILSGQAMTAAQTLDYGLISEIGAEPVVDAGMALADRLAAAGPLPRLRDVAMDEPLAEGYLAFARRSLEKRPTTTTGQLYAVRALTAAATMPFDQGLELELRLFRELFSSDDARVARYRFLAERQAGRVPGAPHPLTVRSVGVVGGGTMGRGIALAFLAASIPVRLIETTDDRADAARAGIASELERAVSRKRISADESAARLASLDVSTELEGLSDADLVVEAVFEDLAAKREVFRVLDAVTRADAILATNTSSLDVDQIGAATSRPSQVVGLHFFSPANVMPLVEVVQGVNTSPQTLATAVKVVARLRKTPVIAQVGDGFIGNRIMDQYVRQAMQLLRAGVTPEAIDRALERWGMAMGPFRVLDLVGNDIPWQARKARALGETARPEWAIADKLCELGWFGQKSGRGWYDYPAPGRTESNSELPGLLAEHVQLSQAMTPEEIVDHCILAMTNEASAVLREGIAARASDIDLVMVKGYGFPARFGGPLYYADELGLDRVLLVIRRFAEAIPSDFFWTPDPLLVELAGNRNTFTRGTQS
ncbi:MAG: 3-hydroxyacyl-CoA dehydrogenase [Actinomycetota bacterium]|nr:3-hydroxyacyl-CoA dehydrogenase [Actinomycetota bacterium]